MMTSTTSQLTVDDLLSNAAWARRLALNLLSDGDAADDLVQETWIAALRARPDADRSLRPWLARVLRNRAANLGRDDGRREMRHQRATDLVDPAAATDPEELLSRMQVQRLLASLVTELPEPARQTVLLRYYEGLTSEEIGQVMGVAAGTVRRRLKEAVDVLRAELDRRHQGNRASWLLALLPVGERIDLTSPPPGPLPADPGAPRPEPVTPAPTRRSPAARSPLPPAAALGPISSMVPKLVVGALALGLTAGGIALVRSSGSSGPPDGNAPVATAPGGRAPGRGGSWLAAGLPGAIGPCHETLATRRNDLAAAEALYRRRVLPTILFEKGDPNPEARAAILPDLERVLRGDSGVALDFTLECRTWACRLLVRAPGDRAEPGWLRSLIFRDRMNRRFAGIASLPARVVRDPVSGATHTELDARLKLKARSGAWIAGPSAPEPVSDPLPASLPDCQSELAAVEQRLAELEPINQQLEDPRDRFAADTPNLPLTAEVRQEVTRLIQKAQPGWTPEVACQGWLCRITVPGQRPSAWRSHLENDPTFEKRAKMVRGEVEGTAYYRFQDPARPDPHAEYLAFAAKLARSIDGRDCEARYPMKGTLEIKLLLAVEEGPDRVPRPGRVELGGDLADTPLGACLQKQLAPRAENLSHPGAPRGGSINRTLTFPLDLPPLAPAPGR
jgi:RNA polymerase sigma factor (sigma-70 family)